MKKLLLIAFLAFSVGSFGFSVESPPDIEKSSVIDIGDELAVDMNYEFVKELNVDVSSAAILDGHYELYISDEVIKDFSPFQEEIYQAPVIDGFQPPGGNNHLNKTNYYRIEKGFIPRPNKKWVV